MVGFLYYLSLNSQTSIYLTYICLSSISEIAEFYSHFFVNIVHIK